MSYPGSSKRVAKGCYKTEHPLPAPLCGRNGAFAAARAAHVGRRKPFVAVEPADHRLDLRTCHDDRQSFWLPGADRRAEGAGLAAEELPLGK